MTNDVNPFEPWRPRDVGGSGRDEEHYPWRAAPRQEPDANAEDDRAERRRALIDDPRVPPPSGANALVALLAIVLIIAGLIVLGSNGSGHFWRVATAAGCFWAGAFLGLSLLHQRRWLTRLGVVLAGLAAGAGCWMFVPTSGGMSWWAAQGVLKDMRALAPGDLAGFQAGQPARAALMEQFKGYRQELDLLVIHWVRATGYKLSAEVDEARADPAAALARIEAAEAALASSPHRGTIQVQMGECWQRVIAARLDQVEKEAMALAEKGQFAAAHEAARKGGGDLRDQVKSRAGTGTLDDRVRAARLKVFARHLGQAKERLQALAAKKEHEEIGREGQRLRVDLLESADQLGKRDEMEQALMPFRRDAFTARLDKARATLEEVLAKEGAAKVTATASRVVQALDDEAKSLDLRGEPARALRPVRLKAFDILYAAQVKALNELLDKKDYAGVERAYIAAGDMLKGEAVELFHNARRDDPAGAIRQKAYFARLDLARERFRALLVKDDYAGIEALAESTAKELGLLADRLVERKALDDFTGRCKAFAKLAAAAGKK